MLNNALVNHLHQFILFWNGKCACTTIKKFFIKSVDDQEGLNIKERDLHIYIMKYYLKNEENQEEFLKQYKKIIVVRNPYSRLVSFFTNKFIINKEPVIVDKRKKAINPKDYNFEDLVKMVVETPAEFLEHHIAPQSLELENIKFNSIIKMEKMSTEMKNELLKHNIDINFNFGQKLGGHDTKYTEKKYSCFKINAGQFDLNNIPNYKLFYNKELAKLIQEYYINDFKKFHYSLIL